MNNDSAFVLVPTPTVEDSIKIATYAKECGYHMSKIDYGYIIQNTQNLIMEEGISHILSIKRLEEAVLPDSTPRSQHTNTLKSMLSRIAPNHSLHIIDPYLFPSSPDPDYATYFMSIFGDSLTRCDELFIATKANRNQALETNIFSRIESHNATIRISTKYTSIFHDRYWIANKSKGLLVGTSLNGIGRKYSTIDYLDDQDTRKIIERFDAL